MLNFQPPPFALGVLIHSLFNSYADSDIEQFALFAVEAIEGSWDVHINFPHAEHWVTVRLKSVIVQFAPTSALNFLITTLDGTESTFIIAYFLKVVRISPLSNSCVVKLAISMAHYIAVAVTDNALGWPIDLIKRISVLHPSAIM